MHDARATRPLFLLLMMNLKNTKELHDFLTTFFSTHEPETDESSVQAFILAATPEKRDQVITQIKDYLLNSESILQDLEMEVNRWFSEATEAQEWLKKNRRSWV